MGDQLVNLVLGHVRADLPSPWGIQAMDCTGRFRSIVSLGSPSCVHIFIARGSLVMILVPSGDLNHGSVVVSMFKRVPLPCNLTDKSSELRQHLIGGKLLLPVVQLCVTGYQRVPYPNTEDDRSTIPT